MAIQHKVDFNKLAWEQPLKGLEKMEKNLQQLMLEEEISMSDFKEHRIRIEAERARLKNTVDVLSQRQHLVKADFEVALQLATELDFLYDKANFDESRLLCETVIKRLNIENGTIVNMELNSPFALIDNKAEGSGSVQGGYYFSFMVGDTGRFPNFCLRVRSLYPHFNNCLSVGLNDGIL
jgi:hypothetical protein